MQLVEQMPPRLETVLLLLPRAEELSVKGSSHAVLVLACLLGTAGCTKLKRHFWRAI